MEQIAITQTAVSGPSLRDKLTAASQQVNVMDPFALIFQQMVQGQDAQWIALGEEAAQDAQEEGTKQGMQMAAEMLAVVPGALLPENLAMLEQNAGAQAVQTGSSKPAAELLQPQQMLLQADPEEEVVLPQQKEGATSFYHVLEAAWKEDTPAVSGRELDFQGNYAVRMAKELLSKEQKETSEPLDIELLQADVNAKRFLPTEALAQKQSLPQPEMTDIVQQLKKGILENTAKGKNEFVVRLKPEGIGEIVVKLAEDKSRISLSIFTASTQTAKLISDEVATLQNALRPLHAEVQQVVVTPSNEQAALYTSQNAFTGDGSNFSGQPYWEQNQRASQEWTQDDEEFDSVVQQVLTQNGELDAYI